MKKRVSLLLGALLASSTITAVAATEDPLKDSLPGLVQKDRTLRPYLKDLVSTSPFSTSEKQQILTGIESPTLFKSLDFHTLISEMPREDVWVPIAHTFSNRSLQQLFQPFSLNLTHSEDEYIFLANVLYDVGTKIYTAAKNSTYLEYAASIGHAKALYKMFSIDFKNGKIAKAANYLFCAAAQQNPEALLALSEAYQGFWGIGVSRDTTVARLLCREATILGHSEAQFRIEVATLTEGLFGAERNFQVGVRKAKELANNHNPRAQKFIDALMRSSGDAIQEGNNRVTNEDLEFLAEFLRWENI
jgi:hypothetical protein